MLKEQLEELGQDFQKIVDDQRQNRFRDCYKYLSALYDISDDIQNDPNSQKIFYLLKAFFFFCFFSGLDFLLNPDTVYEPSQTDYNKIINDIKKAYEENE